jgi:hypothetical protein
MIFVNININAIIRRNLSGQKTLYHEKSIHYRKK